MPRKTSVRGNAPVCTILNYFSWQKALLDFACQNSLCSLKCWCQEQNLFGSFTSPGKSRKAFFCLLLSKPPDCENTLLSTCIWNRKMRLISTRCLNFCLFLQEEAALGGAVTVYFQISTNHCLSRHWVPDLIWQKFRLNKLFTPLSGCGLGTFITPKHLTTSSRLPV